MGNYYIGAAKTISEVVGLTGDQASAITNLSNPENRLVLAAGGASAAKIGVTMVETLGKKLPGYGTALTVTTLGLTVYQISEDTFDPSKVVKTKDFLSAAGDVAGLVSLAALAGVAVLGAPLAVALGIGLTKKIQQFFSLILYLCSEEPDMNRPKGKTPRPTKMKKAKIGKRLFVTENPTIWRVGESIGQMLRQGKSETSTPGNSPRTHIRRAHWHGYWTGSSDQKRFKYNWLSPIVVNVRKNNEQGQALGEVV